MVNTTIKHLRKEAYKMWGLQPRAVVYNMPNRKLKPKQNFVFRLNYSEEFKEWPKSYTLVIPHFGSIERIIMPIIIIEKKLNLRYNAWYDMPIELSGHIINLIKGEPIRHQFNTWQKLFNYFAPTSAKYAGYQKIEDYTYSVSRINDNLVVSVV